MTGSPPRDSVISLIINVILLIHIKAPDLHMVRALDENLKRRMKPCFSFFLSFREVFGYSETRLSTWPGVIGVQCFIWSLFMVKVRREEVLCVHSFWFDFILSVNMFTV